MTAQPNDRTDQSARSARARLYLRTLGESALVRIDADGRGVVVLEPTKLLALLVYLAFSPGRTASRDSMTDLLWADLEPDAARHALRHHLWQLKQRVEPDLIVEAQGRSQLRLRSEIRSDRDDFTDASEHSDFARAVALYKGDFFPGFAATGSSEFEHWIDSERAQLRSRFAHCADAVIRSQLDAGHARDAVALAKRLRAEEPLRQHAWRVLLESLVAANDSIGAAVEAEALERMAAHEGVELEPATRALISAAKRMGPASPAPVDAMTLQTELVGREQEFAALLQAWDRASHGHTTFIHVIAKAGIGKTRLLAEFRARLGSMRARCVLVRANPGAAAVAYALASDLSEVLATMPGSGGVSPDSAKTLVGLNPSLSSVYRTSPAVIDTAEIARHRLIALTELIAVIAEERPLAILIDDLHWSDPASRVLLSGILGKLRTAPVLFVISERPGQASTPLTTPAVELALTPLSRDAIISLVSSIALLPRAAWADAFVRALHEGSQGIPLHVVEGLHVAMQERALTIIDGSWHCESPDRLSQLFDAGGALGRRVRLLDSEESTVMRVLAAAGAPLDDRLMTEATGLSPPVATAALLRLQQRGLAARAGDGNSVTHDEFGCVVLETSDEKVLRATHRALGLALSADAGANLRRLRLGASHLLRAGASSELEDLFTRFYQTSRHQGDHRGRRALAQELLGESAGPAEIQTLARSVTLGTRLRLIGATRVAAAIALLVASAALAVAVLEQRTPRAPPVDAELLVAVHAPPGGDRVYSVPVSEALWEPGAPIRIDTRRKPDFVIPNDWMLPAAVSPVRGDLWAVTRSVPDSGVTDIFVYDDRDHSERRLTFTRGDDVDPDWSPDGRFLAFSTSRWDSLGRRDIAIRDVASGTTKRLTDGRLSAIAPRWSPDGVRIAYRGRYGNGGRDALCVTDIDGVSVRCDTLAHEKPLGGVVGWSNDSTVLISAGEGVAELRTVSVAEHPLRLRVNSPPIARASGDARALSHDGRWLLGWCVGEVPATGACASPTANVARGRPIVFEPDQRVTAVYAWRTPRPSEYLDQIRMPADHAVALLGTPYQLDPQGTDSRGLIIPLHGMRYRALDSSIAIVDSLGVVRGIREGTTTIEMTAGGWRRSSITLQVRGNTMSRVLAEDWSATGFREWRPFGDPKPRVVDDAPEGHALFLDGDANFHTGVYYGSPFDGTSGLAVKAELSTPATRRQWQTFTTAFAFTVNTRALRQWDHTSGYVWARERLGSPAHLCEFDYPLSNESPGTLDTMSMGSTGPKPSAAAPRALSSGAWYTLLLQVFPDGRCGAAVNGEASLLSASMRLPLDSLYLMFIARSVQTRMLLGRVEVYRGIVPGIAWEHVGLEGHVPVLHLKNKREP